MLNRLVTGFQPLSSFVTPMNLCFFPCIFGSYTVDNVRIIWRVSGCTLSFNEINFTWKNSVKIYTKDSCKFYPLIFQEISKFNKLKIESCNFVIFRKMKIKAKMTWVVFKFSNCNEVSMVLNCIISILSFHWWSREGSCCEWKLLSALLFWRKYLTLYQTLQPFRPLRIETFCPQICRLKLMKYCNHFKTRSKH